MATTRGFVHKIEIGREGLVTVSLIETDGTISNYVIRDLDADPERFNERLSKLGILRDAMNRAEPVEIEHTDTQQGQEIQRAARITRDALAFSGTIGTLAGLVLDIVVHTENRAQGNGERSDMALVSILSTDLTPEGVMLDLQIPERGIAEQQLEIIRDAQTYGRLVRFYVTDSRRIISVAVDSNPNSFSDKNALELDGFVESLSLIRMPHVDSSGKSSSLAHVRFTTTPPFTGAGNTVGFTPFTPITVDLLVPKGSLTYDLFEAGLRDNNRMRVSTVFLNLTDKPGDTGTDDSGANTGESDIGSVATTHKTTFRDNALLMMLSTQRLRVTDKLNIDQSEVVQIGIAFAAELLAPLASASRPVWITISRRSLDHGPEGFECTEGLPTSDLRPQTLRDLRIPYPAVWTGIGCFNAGVYRFQFCLPVSFKIVVDGKELCLHRAEKIDSTRDTNALDAHIETGETDLMTSSDTGNIFKKKSPCEIMFAHACLCGEHEVQVLIENWICEYKLIMDIYRIR